MVQSKAVWLNWVNTPRSPGTLEECMIENVVIQSVIAILLAQLVVCGFNSSK